MGGDIVDHHTCPEVGWQGEIGLAATHSGITHEKANEIALKLIPLYKDIFNNPKLGQPFHVLCNNLMITPMQEWQDYYRSAKETLTRLGLTFTQDRMIIMR